MGSTTTCAFHQRIIESRSSIVWTLYVYTHHISSRLFYPCELMKCIIFFILKAKATLEFPTGYFKVDIEEDESSSTQIMLKSNLIFIPYDAKDTMETSTSENRHRSISATHPEALVKCVVESDVKGTEAINCDNCFRYEGFYWHDLKKHFTIYKIIDFLEAMKDAEGNSIVLKANYGCFRGDQKLFRLTIKGDPASVIDPRMDRNVFCIVTDVPFIHEHAAVDVENA